MSDTSSRPFLEIRPSRGWIRLNLGELWEYRDLLYFLTWRDIKVRYKQTLLGATWAVIQPVLTMVIFSLFFGRLGKIPSDGMPYPLFSFAALVPWTLFSTALPQSSNSLVGSSNLLRKIYFPRLIIRDGCSLPCRVDERLEAQTRHVRQGNRRRRDCVLSRDGGA